MDSQRNQKSIFEEPVVVGRRIYYKTPAIFQRLLWPVKILYKLFNVLRLDMWIIAGDEISSRQKLAITYVGHEVGKNYFIKLAFGSFYREDYIGKKWLWKIPEIIEESNRDCSLMVAEAPDSFRILSKKIKCFYIPSWLFGEMDIPVDKSALFRKKKSSLKSDLRKIRRNRLHFEVTKKLTDLHDFYYNMHLPYISKAYNHRFIIANYDLIKRNFKKRRPTSDLLLVKKENEYIAGILFSHKKNRARLWILGVKDGDVNYVKDGAIGAGIYFSVLYLADKGVTKIGLGRSRPFLKDGVLQYKKKWNQTVSPKKGIVFLIKPLSKSDGVKGFFLNNPFIYEDKAGLNGAIFVADDQSLSNNDFERIDKEYYVKGLSKLVVYPFGKADDKIWGIVPPEFSDRITMCSAETIF